MDIKHISNRLHNDLGVSQKPTAQTQPSNTQQAPNEKGEKARTSEFSSVTQSAMTALANTPEVRNEKVAAIRQAIADGTYEINSRAIAEKLLGLEQQLPGDEQ